MKTCNAVLFQCVARNASIDCATPPTTSSAPNTSTLASVNAVAMTSPNMPSTTIKIPSANIQVQCRRKDSDAHVEPMSLVARMASLLRFFDNFATHPWVEIRDGLQSNEHTPVAVVQRNSTFNLFRPQLPAGTGPRPARPS